MFILQNVIDNYNYLRAEFIGFSINVDSIKNFILSLIITSLLLLIFFFIGEKIRIWLFKENNKFIFFVNIALGYLVIGTVIGLLGIFSLLAPIYLYIALGLIFIIAFCPYPNSYSYLFDKFKKSISLNIFKRNLLFIAVVLFVLIAFLRLINPEIAEDGYHTDLPRSYLLQRTSIIDTKDPLHVTPYPQLAEMIYIIPIFLGDKEAVRFIHFSFYILIISLLFYIKFDKKNIITKYAPLFFVSTPIVIRYSSTQYIDFFMVFYFLLGTLLIEKNKSYKNLILSGIILGGALSIKIWTLVYLPAILVYILIIKKYLKKSNLLKQLGVYILSSMIVPSIWYIRDYIITGNPIYPFFSNLETKAIVTSSISNYVGINFNMFAYQNLIVLSPLYFLSLIYCIFNYKKIIRYLKKYLFFLFFVVMTVEQLIVKVDLGRYLLVWYTISIIFISAGIYFIKPINKYLRFIFIISYVVIFLYYFVNTLLILPYGLGWANKNAYLTRVLSRDNASYYNFDNLFNKFISKKDLVATYGIYSYYYADFAYIDVGYIFGKDNKSFDLLQKRKVTKLLVKGGDFKWFCKELDLIGCKSQKVKLLATYPADLKKYNLYLIQY